MHRGIERGYPKLIQTPARYDFEYEEDEEDESGDVDIENKYYNAKQMKLLDPEDAVIEFLGIPPLEQEKGEWGFKGLKQAIKLEVKLGKYDQVRCSSQFFCSCASSSLLTTRPGRGSFCRAPDIREISSHKKLLGKVNQ